MSGKNSVQDRNDAASDLRRWLVESLNKYPSATHILIAHSHGGNVSLQAIDDPQLGTVRLICLSTPILRAIPRPLLNHSTKFFWISLSGILMILLALGGLAEESYLSRISNWVPALVLLLLCTTLVGGFIGFWKYKSA